MVGGRKYFVRKTKKLEKEKENMSKRPRVPGVRYESAEDRQARERVEREEQEERELEAAKLASLRSAGMLHEDVGASSSQNPQEVQPQVSQPVPNQQPHAPLPCHYVLTHPQTSHTINDPSLDMSVFDKPDGRNPIDGPNTSGNKRMFRHKEAWKKFNQPDFISKKCSKPYLFKLDHQNRLERWEHDKVEEMIGFWAWKPLVELDTPYNEKMVKLLYANMQPMKEPWGIVTWYDGTQMTLTIPKLAKALFGVNVPNMEDHEQIYPYRVWPRGNEPGSVVDYKNWFKPGTNDNALTSTFLPAIYRLANSFINNILMPKIDFKTNMETNSIFLLRHLIQRDRQFHIPFIILSHIRNALTGTSSLPYAHILCAMVRGYKKPLPIDIKWPENIVSKMDKLGFKREGEFWNTGGHPSDLWIKEDGAALNQFTRGVNDPEPEPVPEPVPMQPEYMHQPNFMPQPNYMPQEYHPYPTQEASFFPPPQYEPQYHYSGPWSQPPTAPEDFMGYLVAQMGNLSTGFLSSYAQNAQHFETTRANQERMNQMEQRMIGMEARMESQHALIEAQGQHITQLQAFNDALELNWDNTFPDHKWVNPHAPRDDYNGVDPNDMDVDHENVTFDDITNQGDDNDEFA